MNSADCANQPACRACYMQVLSGSDGGERHDTDCAAAAAITRRAYEAAGEAMARLIGEPIKLPAANVARMLGYNPDDFSSIEWDGDDIVMIRNGNAMTIEFTIGCGALDDGANE
jgi:hypothetical protein